MRQVNHSTGSTRFVPSRVEAPVKSARGAILVRLGWMVAGTLTILISALMIASEPTWTLGLRDLVFWVAVVATGILRYVDISRFHGETTNGEPATAAHLKRYLTGLTALAAVAWLAAQSLHI